MTFLEKDWALRGSQLPLRTIWMDIETRKVFAPANWPYLRRWSVMMVAEVTAVDDRLYATVYEDDDEGALLSQLAWGGCEARYKATRDFDQMVLRGRFTNARRALNPKPGPWPNLDQEPIVWKNIARNILPPCYRRSKDIPSIDVPKAYNQGQLQICAVHCLKDAVEVLLRDPEVRLSATLKRNLINVMEG